MSYVVLLALAIDQRSHNPEAIRARRFEVVGDEGGTAVELTTYGVDTPRA